MVLKGNISTVDNINRKARVILRNMDNSVTSEVMVAKHVGVLEINDLVAVIFFSDNLSDGLVIGKF